jgi:hypothetical protein
MFIGAPSPELLDCHHHTILVSMSNMRLNHWEDTMVAWLFMPVFGWRGCDHLEK